MEIEKQERAFDIFYLESKSRGLVMFRSFINQDRFLIHTPYCRWIAIEKRIGKITKFEGDFYCESVGKTSTSATDKEQIAFYISNLPSTDWTTIDLNFAQTCEWIIHRTLAIRIAKCFLDGASQPDDSLIWELNQGTIDEYQLKYYRLFCDRLKNLWTLITRYEKKIKQVLAKQGGYPFNNHLELFQEIVKPLIEESFLRCLQRNHINRPREIKNLINLSRHQLNDKDLSQVQKEKFSKLIKKYPPHNPWRDRVIQVATALAETDDLIRAHVQIDKVLTDALLAMAQKAYCDPSLKYHAEKLYAWRGGVWYPS